MEVMFTILPSFKLIESSIRKRSKTLGTPEIQLKLERISKTNNKFSPQMNSMTFLVLVFILPPIHCYHDNMINSLIN